MKTLITLIIAAVLVAAGVAGGYFIGRNKSSGEPSLATSANTVAAVPAAAKAKKLLFYRNPMGLPDTSPVPKKDSMGMDYIAVYEGEDGGDEAGAANQIRISTEKIQKLGVRTEAASLRSLDRIVRAAGRIEPDERRIYTVSAKFEGYVERLHVNVTGQPVSRGQPLFEVYSPELVSAQREYAIAARGIESLKEAGGEAQNAMRQLADASLTRLSNWDISEEQVKALAKSGDARRTLTFRSPVTGIVTEKKALQGMRFMPGEVLYQVADLSSVWVIADVFEQDIGNLSGMVKSRARARVRINAYPDKVFMGTITYVYPQLTAATRTVPVRVELANPGVLLKPGMFAQVELAVGARARVLTVPLSAVIDSGTRQIVLVEAKEGRFESRAVKLGARSEDYVEVLEGVKDGEPVVVAANFLIDAESNLKAAIGGFGLAKDGGKTIPAAGHSAQGRVEEIDSKAGTVSISHGPVASLKWPAMTMDFKVANSALLKDIKPGAAIAFEFVERGQGEWLLISVKPAVRPQGSPATNPHAAH